MASIRRKSNAIQQIIISVILLVAVFVQFRLMAVLASDREPVTSDETSVITTLPSGLPSSAPLNLKAVVLDSFRVSISWDPPLFPNGPLISYSLNIKEAFPRGPQVYPGFQVNIKYFLKPTFKYFSWSKQVSLRSVNFFFRDRERRMETGFIDNYNLSISCNLC